MPRTGLATLIHMSYEGATIKSLGLLRAPGLFVCLLRQASSPRMQLKKPSTLRVGGYVPEIGIEPIHPCGRQILSLLRLPVSPPGREEGKGTKIIDRGKANGWLCSYLGAGRITDCYRALRLSLMRSRYLF